MDYFVRRLKCAFGPSPCFICCVKNVKESTTTRLLYTIILIAVTILATSSHEGGLSRFLYLRYKDEIDRFCSFVQAGDACYRLIGFVGVYRICLPLFTFHILMALLMIGVYSSQTLRGRIHNGFWLWKIIFIVLLWALAYSFPTLETLVRVWMVLGIIGGILFIYIQHITLIDFAYELNGIWHIKSKSLKCYSFLIYLVTLLLYFGTMAVYTFFIFHYGLPYHCTLNLTVTGINAGLTLLFAICSVFSNTLRERQLWLPGAVTSAFVAFLTWSALGNQPKLLSSNVPWQRKTVSQIDDNNKSNVTAHPLLIVADQLNRLLSEQFRQSDTKDFSSLNTKIKSTILINQCLPGGVSTISEHLGKDIVTFTGILVVVGGSLYSSFRATMQARRLGIRTRRERLKALLPTLQESPKSNNSAVSSVPNPTMCDASQNHYLNYKQVKRQEKALNLLAAAVSDLPSPKIFRRPSARQPPLKSKLVNQKPSNQQQDRTNLDKTSPAIVKRPKNTQTPLLIESNSSALVDTSDVTNNFYSGLRLASSEPDLTITIRQCSANRTDIRNFDWSDNKKGLKNEMLTGYLRPKSHKHINSKLVNSEEECTNSNNKNGVCYIDPTANYSRKCTKFARNKNNTKKDKASSKDKTLLAELSLMSDDALPEKIGPNHCLSIRKPSDVSVVAPMNNVFRRSQLNMKRSSVVGTSTNSPLYSKHLKFFNDGDICTIDAPDHVKIQRARWVSDWALSRRATHLFETQPGLSSSLAFLVPMLTTAAPRDGFIMYNEAIASVYSYPWFHLIYALATLYLMTQLTNWYNPRISRVDTMSESWANMWMKLASSWLALTLYAWTIVCPRLCIGRKLGDTPFTPRVPQSNPVTTVLPV